MVWSPAFNRFAVASALSGAADAIVAVSLAGSLFFSLSPEASREQVLLYLVINMAPFALLAPLVGPAIDHFRLGHRWISAILFALRAACAAALAFTLLDLALYFFALALLVGAKAFGVVRQALVPELVDEPDQLVAANSRLARLNVIAGAHRRRRSAVSCSPSPARRRRRSPSPASRSPRPACVSLLLPSITPREVLTPSVEYEELHAPTIVATSWAFTAIRAAVGFFVFGLAFALRRTSEPAWMYGAAIAAYGAGTYLGNVGRAAAAATLRRGPPHRRRARRAGRRAGVRRPRAVTCDRPARVARARRRRGGRPPGLRRDGPDARPDGDARPLVRPLRDPVPARLGRRRAWPRRRSPSRSATAWRCSPSCCCRRRGGTSAPCAPGQAAHAEDPFDPLEVARRRIDHAVEWHRRDLDRLAVTELAGVVDLARATGRRR